MEKRELALECAGSITTDTYNGIPFVGEACFALYEMDKETSVLKILKAIKKDKKLPVGYSFFLLDSAIDVIEFTSINEAGIFLKEDYKNRPPSW